MAYADPFVRKPVDPFSLATSVLLGGSIIGLISLAAPNIVNSPDDFGRIGTVELTPPPPPPIPETKVEKKETAPPELVPVRTKDNVRQPPPLTHFTPPPIEQKTPPAPPIPPAPPLEQLAKPEPKAPPIVATPVHVPIRADAALDQRFARQFQPNYPTSMIRAGIEGRVVVRVLISTNGTVSDVRIVSSPDEAFSNATRDQALKKWRFKPATEDGKPVETWRQMAVVFRLDRL